MSVSHFAFCLQRREGRFQVFSFPIKNKKTTIRSIFHSFQAQDEVLTKISLLNGEMNLIKASALNIYGLLDNETPARKESGTSLNGKSLNVPSSIS